ncbi:MAG: hypothetical protein HF962_06785 [Sulfurovum sp.]|nr:hypothetical protein [Sulfurovum sp.]
MKIDKDKSIFLLGGKDLEMLEIKRVLKEHDVKDHALAWDTSSLTAYKKELEANPGKTFYAVELNIDENDEVEKKLLKTYDIHIIDHHGKKHNDKEASLLQILKLLNITPTKDQKHIAANDARYIEGMKCIGATDDEIVDIRKRDKEAQHIILHDESIAQADVQKRVIKKYISIVYARTPHFSAITDSLYFDFSKENRTAQSIVYNDDKIVFYGFESEYIKGICEKFDIKEKHYYYGGGDTGYLGIKDKVINAKRMEKMIDSTVNDRPLYSSHVFMFPFRFDYAKKPIVNAHGQIHEYEFYYNTPIEERINLENIKDILKKENWHYEKYATHNDSEKIHLAYNEFSYFYDYAKDALYNREEFSQAPISSFFRKQDKDGKNMYEGELYSINVFDTKDGEVIGSTMYDLEIEGVSLRIFHTGVAILSIELENYKYKEFKDILRINDYGRRVYPQFIGNDEKNRTDTTKKSFLPNSIRIGSDATEDFKTFHYEDIEIGNHIMQVLGRGLFEDKKYFKDAKKYDRFYIQPSLDDRMFVMSWYGNDGISANLATCYNYKQDDDWYRYVFVDGKWATVENSMMKKVLLKDATYDRWSGYNTLYGITRYSFVLLSSSLPELKKNKAEMIVKHMNTMYFQMATLLLANRTSILRFSDEIAALVSPVNKADIDKHTQKLENLYDIYLKYYNRLYFKEVTHQDQGIELYDIGIRQMRIGEHVDKLDGKFEKLFNFANLKAEKKSSKAMNTLTYFGGLFLVPTFVVSLFELSGAKEFMTIPYIAWVGIGAVVGFCIAKYIMSRGEN